jgi:hypothetical protein
MEQSASQEIPSSFLYGIQSFITVFTRASHWTLSWVRWSKFISIHPSYFFNKHCNNTLPSTSKFSKLCLPFMFWDYNFVLSHFCHACYIPCQYYPWSDHSNNVLRRVKFMYFPPSFSSFPLGLKYSLQHLFSNKVSVPPLIPPKCLCEIHGIFVTYFFTDPSWTILCRNYVLYASVIMMTSFWLTHYRSGSIPLFAGELDKSYRLKFSCIRQHVNTHITTRVLLTRFHVYISSVGIALGDGLEDRSSMVRFLAEAGNFSLHHCVRNCSGSHSASYTMGTRGSFPRSKAAGAGSWPLTSI